MQYYVNVIEIVKKKENYLKKEKIIIAYKLSDIISRESEL